MKISRNTYINAQARPNGQRNVSGYYGESKGWLPMGVLQPELVNHVSEQPKSLAQKLLEKRS